MTDEKLVENVVTPYWMRRAHLVSMGVAPDAGRWLHLLRDDERETLEIIRTHEDGLDIHNLVMIWQSRGPAVHSELGPVIIWYVGGMGRNSDALDHAAVAHWRYYQRAPNRCRIHFLPERTAKRHKAWVPRGNEQVGEDVVITIEVDETVPKGYLLVYEARDK